MSDILDDYREWQADRQRWATFRTHSDRCHVYHDECMVVRMAAEIARLRAEVERLQADRETAVFQAESDYQHEIARLRDEVEQLRAATTNHDAAPATTAAELARSPGQSPRGTGGTTPKPVLWLVENSHGVVVDLFDNAANAQRQVDRFNIERLRLEYHAVPLYRDPPPPTLTDAEREALDNAAKWLVAIQSADDPRAGECASTLRGLLARLGGGK